MKLNRAGFKNGIITLDDANAVYYPAQTISGKIEFELQESSSFSAISVIYRGEANVSWTEQQTEKYSGVKRYINVEYKASEEYFNFVQCVYGGNGISILPSGTYSIPFSYQIPYMAPSSFESVIGSVSYKIIAYLESPTVMREELMKTFEIVAPLDLNKDTTGDIKRPIRMGFEEVYSCCCSSLPITVAIEVPVSGFCPGQAIPIELDVNNRSNMEISKMRFQLVMKERYHSKSPVSLNTPPEQILATMKKGAIMGKTRRRYQCDLQVPEMLAPNLDNCSIIDVEYFFKVTIKLAGCNDDLQDERKLYIGLIPLEITTGGSSYVHPLKHRLPRGPPPFGLPMPYGNNNGVNQPTYEIHIPLRSPQMIENHSSPITYPPVASPYPYPYHVQHKILPSAPVETPSSFKSYPVQSPVRTHSPRNVYPYPVHHQTLVTASIEATSPHQVNSCRAQNQTPSIVSVVNSRPPSEHSYRVQNQTPVKTQSPQSGYPNQVQNPMTQTTPLRTTSPRKAHSQSPQTVPINSNIPQIVITPSSPYYSIQHQSALNASTNVSAAQVQNPQIDPIETTSPQTINPLSVSPQSAPIETTSPQTINPLPVINQSPQSAPIETTSHQTINPLPVINQSPQTAPIETTSPRIINPLPVINQSPQTAPIETNSPQTINPLPVINQSPQTAPIETTILQTINPLPIINQSPQSAPIETTSPQTINPLPVINQSPQTAPIETTSPRTINSLPVINQSPQTAPIETTSPQTINPLPVINQSPQTAPIETTSPRTINPLPVINQSPQTAPTETTSPQTINPLPVINQSPQTAPTETTSPQTINPLPVINQSPQTAPIEITSPHTAHSNQTSPLKTFAQSPNSTPTSCADENKPYEIGFKV